MGVGLEAIVSVGDSTSVTPSISSINISSSSSSSLEEQLVQVLPV